ncbi:MAG: phospholipase D-like domain-containing protein [Verrucomicrobiota bacterium]|nr:phospholipase D-like domain-containing protein [Verrucomicrobiota bacterium]
MKTHLKTASSAQQRAFSGAFQPEIVGRLCQLQRPPLRKIKPLQIKGEFIAYASPESTFAVTKPLLEAARKSILIGIYDFTAGYMKELLLRALSRGVKVSLMLDLDGRSGETPLFNDLAKHGCECVPAPSCASTRAHFFASSHEKVIVIDDQWVLVQSGNWSDASIPLNEKDGGDPQHFTYGNRDMGLAVKCAPLAKFFTAVLRGDMALELGVEALPEDAMAASIEAFGAKPTSPAPKLFPSKRFKLASAISVTPVLSPDNYMTVVPAWLASARKSVEIEQQYIRNRQPAVQKLLAAMVEAQKKNPKLVLRIILGHPASPAETEDIRNLSDFGLKLGSNVRLISRKHFVHCHNKTIIVDGTSILVSSQNWSDSAVTKNREAGLLLASAPIARYFRSIFEVDWATGEKTIEEGAVPEIFAPESLATGRTIRLNWGDYAEV